MSEMKIEGNTHSINRVRTDMFSLDSALSSTTQPGMPVPGIVEIYGRTHVGKSTLAYHLASQMNKHGRVVLCDFEGLDMDYIRRAFEQEGFDGTLKVVSAIDSKGKLKSHESMLDELTEEFYKSEVSAGIVDSVGMISPIFEVENDIEGGFGAKRASIVARFVRRLLVPLVGMEIPRPLFITNHAHSVVGGGYGHQSAGGRALEHAKVASLYMYRKSNKNIKTGDEILATAVEGKVEKLRYGGRVGRTFNFFIIPDRGVRANLTAMQDCVDLGLAERGAVVKIGDKSFGRIGELVEADLNGDNEVFAPFYELLEQRRKDEFGTTDVD